MTKRTALLSLFILIKLLLQHFLINSGYDLHRDEYLHLDQAHHLAWGYESVPPFSSWIAYIILQLGNAVFWIKFFPALFGALTILVVWKTIEALNGNLFALIMGATAVCFSAILRINILFQPNSFDILSWTFFYYATVKYINSRQNKWLYFAAIAFAIGFLNKYNIVFLLLGIAPAILLTEHRRLYLNRHFYLAIAVSLLIISPNLVWQFHNKFPVVYHMKELSETQLVNVQRIDFLKEQLLFFLGSVFVLIAGVLSFFIYPVFKKYRLFFWSYLFTLCIFTYFKAKGYYAIGLYPVLLAFGAVYLERLTQTGWKKWLRPLFIFIPVVLFILLIKLVFPVLNPAQIAQHSNTKTLNRWEDGKVHSLPQDFADMLGWRELAAKTDSAYRLVNDNEHTLVLCDNYGEAGAVNYYSRQNIHAVSMNADYINWFPFDKNILHIISVKVNSDTSLIREKNIFDTLIKTGEVNNEYAREKATAIFILSGAKANVNNLLREEIGKRKF